MEIDEIVKKLKIDNQVIAIKTDTVYGLICNALDREACEKIYDIKQREKKKPLSIFVRDIEDLKQYVDDSQMTDKVITLMKKYWPGALTIILKKKTGVLDYITCGFDSIGIRIPNDRQLLEILDKINFPLAETSCNISGETEYNNASEIREKLGDKIDLIVDGGDVVDNVPSTVIEILDDKIKVIRQGEIFIDE